MKGKRTFAEKAYQTTLIEAGDTQVKIQNMLEELGISHLRFTQDGPDYRVEFIVKLRTNEAPRKVQINVPLRSNLGESLRKKQQHKNAMFRVLFYHLKSRFVVITNGLREFEEEFLSDIVVTINGKEQRLGDVLAPEIKKQLKHEPKVILKIAQ